jgi:hypothetical protein
MQNVYLKIEKTIKITKKKRILFRKTFSSEQSSLFQHCSNFMDENSNADGDLQRERERERETYSLTS